MSTLRGRPPTLADRLYDGVAFLALPAPHIVRALVAGAFLVVIGATATVASADALPDDPLYGMKLAGEQVRLALALSPTDRAAVELSLAGHRLDEAERLAVEGRDVDALAAASAYGQHLASAAAALATVESGDEGEVVVEQLRESLGVQQQHAAGVADRLPVEAGSVVEPALRTIASRVPSNAGQAASAQQIAEHAALISDHSATEAERLAPPASGHPEARPPAAPSAAAQVTAAAAPSAHSTPRETARPTVDPQTARAAAEKARQDAEKARESADKARDAANRSPHPTPSPRR